MNVEIIISVVIFIFIWSPFWWPKKGIKNAIT